MGLWTGNLAVRMTGLKKAKGECLLHVIGHNQGIICRNVSIEQVGILNPIRFTSKHDGFSANEVAFSSGARHTGSGNDDKNGFEIIEFWFAILGLNIRNFGSVTACPENYF